MDDSKLCLSFPLADTNNAIRTLEEDLFAVATLKHVKAWLNFWSRPPAKIKPFLFPCILILKVAKTFQETFFRGVELIGVEVM